MEGIKTRAVFELFHAKMMAIPSLGLWGPATCHV